MHCRKRLQNPVRFSSTRLSGVNSTLVGPGSGNGTRSRYSLKEGGHRGGSSSRKGVRVIQPVLHSFKEGWRFASHFRSASIEPLSQQTDVPDAYTQTGRVSNQVRGLVCHVRSFVSIHPHTQLHRRLVDSCSIRADDGSTSRCCARSHESVGVKTERQEECDFSITENHLSCCAFVPAGHYITSPVTSRPSIGHI